MNIQCCKKDMIIDEHYFNYPFKDENRTYAVCVSCGHFYGIIEGQLNEEELEIFLESTDDITKSNPVTGNITTKEAEKLLFEVAKKATKKAGK